MMQTEFYTPKTGGSFPQALVSILVRPQPRQGGAHRNRGHNANDRLKSSHGPSESRPLKYFN